MDENNNMVTVTEETTDETTFEVEPECTEEALVCDDQVTETKDRSGLIMVLTAIAGYGLGKLAEKYIKKIAAKVKAKIEARKAAKAPEGSDNAEEAAELKVVKVVEKSKSTKTKKETETK